MIPYLTIILAVCSLFATAYVNLVRPARKHRKATLTAPAVPAPELAPEPRTPGDLDRSYPRPKGGRRKADRTCPVCGTGDTTGSLDGKVLGWPAHASCAEWLGDWKPPNPAPPPFKPDKALIGHMERGQKAIPVFGGTATTITVAASGAPAGPGSAATHIVPNGSFPIASADDLARAQDMVRNGLISAGEFRERLNQQIAWSWGVPPAILEDHTHKAGDPIPIERCPECGAQFCGPPDYLRSAYRMHLQTGCRQSSSPA